MRCVYCQEPTTTVDRDGAPMHTACAGPLTAHQQRAVLASLAYWQGQADERQELFGQQVRRVDRLAQLLNEAWRIIDGAPRCESTAATTRCYRVAGHDDEHTNGGVRWSGP